MPRGYVTTTPAIGHHQDIYCMGVFLFTKSKTNMANRRMFALSVINSARFLKMPIDSQNLYFHLGLRADDDGVVEAFTVMRQTGSSEDNLRVLATKGFIKILNEDLVSFITDWSEHNAIRADRKIDSVYKDLLLQMVPEIDFLEAKPRADRNDDPSKRSKTKGRRNNGTAMGRPKDDNGTLMGRHRLGKDRLGKVKLSKDNNKEKYKKEISNSEKMKVFVENRENFISKLSDDSNVSFVRSEVEKFIDYWTEKNNAGRERWEMEKTFEVERRLKRWFKNREQWGGNTTQRKNPIQFFDLSHAI